MTATAAMENATGAGKISTREDRLHRGRKVTMAFLMQGWGQFFNQTILIVLLLIFHHGQGGPPYSERVAQWTYRVSFAIPAVGTLWLVCKYLPISYCYSQVVCLSVAQAQCPPHVLPMTSSQANNPPTTV
jgi:hypothetical protein